MYRQVACERWQLAVDVPAPRAFTPRRVLRLLAALIPLAELTVPAVSGQEPAGTEPRVQGSTWAVGAQAIGLITRATPALHGEALNEVYLTQPNLTGRLSLWGGRIGFTGTLNLEGITLRDGELNAGIWGEGYVDRRHPHTYLHEAMATARLAGRASTVASVSIGKGFVPFGTDDPMVRPFVKYPANHHLAQILERLVGVAAVRHGPLILEAALFNGDEPDGPGHLGTPRRFGDSWSTRATLIPGAGIELTGSYAAVESPEFPSGEGLDHRKSSLALRYAAAGGGGRHVYALLEWARTEEYLGEEKAFTYHSTLAEAAVSRRGTGIALRYERTLRPEEERLADPFRSPRPHHDFNVLGLTRWDILTARIGRVWRSGEGYGFEPFLEIAHLWATQERRPSVFVPAEFYGSDRMWSLSAGIRVQAGTLHRRMGRYGAAAPHPGAAEERSH